MSRNNSRKTNSTNTNSTNSNTKLHSYSYRTILIIIIICIIIIKEFISETKLISNIITTEMMTMTMTMATAVHGNMQEISSQSSTTKTKTKSLVLVENNDDNDNEFNIHSYFSSSLSMTMNVDDLYERNYFYRAWNNSIENNSIKNGNNVHSDNNNNNNNNNQNQRLPKPMNVLIDYISQHSNQQLEKEWLECQSSQSEQSREREPQNNTSYDIDNYCPTLHDQRQYLVATYSCPIESGNRLHRFMNGLLWSVLTNRTFLWRYHSNDVCQEYSKNDNEGKTTKNNCDKEYNPSIVKGSHDLDCLGLLHKSNWIPSYDKWKSRLLISDSDIMKAEIYDGQKTYDTITVPYDPDPYNGEEDNDNTNTSRNFIIRTGKQVNLNPGSIFTIELEPILLNNRHRYKPTKHLIQSENLQRLSDLRSSYGHAGNVNSSSSASDSNKNNKLSNIYFIYGMLFESMFTIDSSLDPSHALLATAKQQHSDTDTNNTKSNTVVPQSNNNRTNIETVFLHSRHAGHFANDYIWPEHLCLEKLFPKQQQIIAAVNETNVTTTTTTASIPLPLLPILPPCHIYVMSDAPITVKLVHKEIHDNTRCTSSSTSSMHKYNNNNNNSNNNNITEIDERQITTTTGTGKTGISFSAEHGPRAGRGYWEDLSLAIHARSGMIAFHMFHRKHNLVRTSTALIKEIIDFRRYLEFTSTESSDSENSKNDNDNNSKKLLIPSFYECTNPWKDKKKKNKKKGKGK